VWGRGRGSTSLCMRFRALRRAVDARGRCANPAATAARRARASVAAAGRRRASRPTLQASRSGRGVTPGATAVCARLWCNGIPRRSRRHWAVGVCGTLARARRQPRPVVARVAPPPVSDRCDDARGCVNTSHARVWEGAVRRVARYTHLGDCAAADRCAGQFRTGGCGSTRPCSGPRRVWCGSSPWSRPWGRGASPENVRGGVEDVAHICFV